MKPTRLPALPQDTLPWAAAAVIAAVVVAPLDLSQLVFVILGAATYWLVNQAPTVPRRPQRGPAPAPVKGTRTTTDGALQRPAKPSGLHAAAADSQCDSTSCEALSVSVQPVLAPVFVSADFDTQVEELLVRLEPSAQTLQGVRELAHRVSDAVRPDLPEASVRGYAFGECAGGTAFGVAVPAVEVVVSVDVAVLTARLQAITGRSPTPDLWRLQKAAARLCTDRLVARGLFKFRRSAFKAAEPKVTLLAPAAVTGEPLPFDLAVNAATPARNAALLAACGRLEPRARALILLVRRWAKDRGICHAAKGHLSPYAWTLLAIYFLQVGVCGEGPLLPPLGRELLAATTCTADDKRKLSLGALFRAFFAFNASELNWHHEAVAPHLGRRSPPSLDAQLYVVLRADQSADLAPTIQDPFEPTRNVATSCSAHGLTRLRFELQRAAHLSAAAAPLEVLLEPRGP